MSREQAPASGIAGARSPLPPGRALYISRPRARGASSSTHWRSGRASELTEHACINCASSSRRPDNNIYMPKENCSVDGKSSTTKLVAVRFVGIINSAHYSIIYSAEHVESPTLFFVCSEQGKKRTAPRVNCSSCP
jgi:hypothetical protein